MEDIIENFDPIKFSALSKAKQINSFVKNVTIGPNRTLIEDEDETSTIINTNQKQSKPSKVILRRSSNSNSTNLVINQLRCELEKQRQDKVTHAVNEHINYFKQFSDKQKLETEQRILIQQQLLLNKVQQQELMINNCLEQHEKDSSAQHQQLVQYYSELAEKKRKNDMELQEKEKRKQQMNSIIDRLKTDQIEFRTIYQEIYNLLKNCKYQHQLKAVLGDTLKQLKSMPECMDEVVIQCKNGIISESDCHKTNKLVQAIKGQLEVVKEKVAQVNEAQETPIETPAPPPRAPTVPAPTTTFNPTSKAEPVQPSEIFKFISKASLKTYTELQGFLQHFESSFIQLMNDDSLKQFRFDCKKAVNIPVNAISATSATHLTDKYTRLSNLLSGKTVEVGGTRVCAASHPQGVAYCLNLLANNLVLQGDLMVSSKPEAAFSYSAVIVALWNEHADFGKLLLAHFHLQCPFLVPWYPPHTGGQTDEEFYRSQGYRYIDGVVEKQDKFLKRMIGTMRLYAAIIITKPKKGHDKNQHSIDHGWRWLASFVNLEPKQEISATILFVFLETAGSTLYSVYGKSFKKLMMYICQIYFPMIQSIDSGGPVTRLEVLLQNYIKEGHFQNPKGYLPSNFW